MPRVRTLTGVPVALGAVVLLVGACGPGPAVTTEPAGRPTPPVVGRQELTITARNIEFEPQGLRATTGAPILLTLRNQDVGIPHNVVVTSGGVVVTKSPVITGPATTSVEITGAPVGALAIVCEIHPNMTATLEVSAP